LFPSATLSGSVLPARAELPADAVRDIAHGLEQLLRRDLDDLADVHAGRLGLEGHVGIRETLAELDELHDHVLEARALRDGADPLDVAVGEQRTDPVAR